MQRSSHRRVYTVALFTGLLFVVGIATAAWLASGTGSGYAKAGTAQSLATLDASASAVGDLYPGGSGDLYLTISNPNPYPVTITAVTGSASITSSSTGCVSPDHGVTFADQTGLSLAVPANSSAGHVLDGAVAMAATSPDACGGATFQIPVALSGVSGAGTTSGGTIFTYYEDKDADGYGNETEVASTSETPPPGASAQTGDCNDEDAGIHPGATETVGDGIDQDCDGQYAYYQDADNDTYGRPNIVSSTSSTPPAYMSGSSDDCNDDDADIYPGAPVVPYDGIDNDCDGSFDEGTVDGCNDGKVETVDTYDSGSDTCVHNPA